MSCGSRSWREKVRVWCSAGKCEWGGGSLMVEPAHRTQKVDFSGRVSSHGLYTMHQTLKFTHKSSAGVTSQKPGTSPLPRLSLRLGLDSFLLLRTDSSLESVPTRLESETCHTLCTNRHQKTCKNFMSQKNMKSGKWTKPSCGMQFRFDRMREHY